MQDKIVFDMFIGTLCYSPQKVCKIVVAVACLHNFCIDNNLPADHRQEQAGNNAVEQALDDPIAEDGRNPAVALRRRLIEDVFC
jgi:hypothetical protein